MDKKLKRFDIINGVISTYYLILTICLVFFACENFAFMLFEISIMPSILYFLYMSKKGYFEKIKKQGKTNITNYCGYIIFCASVLYFVYAIVLKW